MLTPPCNILDLVAAILFHERRYLEGEYEDFRTLNGRRRMECGTATHDYDLE